MPTFLFPTSGPITRGPRATATTGDPVEDTAPARAGASHHEAFSAAYGFD